MEAYTGDYHSERHRKTVYSASTILSILAEMIPPLESAVDVGCGVGTWLSVLRKMGVKHVQGVDGTWVDQNLLVIPKESFQSCDLSLPLTLSRRFDLAISLEVAEHLPRYSAEEFVGSLTSLSDFVLFSAAIPFQGGADHVNEQWPDYWGERFAARGYVGCDVIRARIWNDLQIPFWYRQNVLLYVKKERKVDVTAAWDGFASTTSPLPVVHPELYSFFTGQSDSVRGSFRLFRRTLNNFLRKRIGRKEAGR